MNTSFTKISRDDNTHNQNVLVTQKVPIFSVDPSIPNEGYIYYNSSDKNLCYSVAKNSWKCTNDAAEILFVDLVSTEEEVSEGLALVSCLDDSFQPQPVTFIENKKYTVKFSKVGDNVTMILLVDGLNKPSENLAWSGIPTDTPASLIINFESVPEISNFIDVEGAANHTILTAKNSFSETATGLVQVLQNYTLQIFFNTSGPFFNSRWSDTRNDLPTFSLSWSLI